MVSARDEFIIEANEWVLNQLEIIDRTFAEVGHLRFPKGLCGLWQKFCLIQAHDKNWNNFKYVHRLRALKERGHYVFSTDIGFIKDHYHDSPEIGDYWFPPMYLSDKKNNYIKPRIELVKKIIEYTKK